MINKLLTLDVENHPIIVACGREVVGVEIEALIRLEQALDEDFVAACETIYGIRRQLALTGMITDRRRTASFRCLPRVTAAEVKTAPLNTLPPIC